MPKVSVIIPVYNVELYIERCIISLFEQTLDDLEFIFVNDCTPDDSMIIIEKILKGYPSRIKQVKIINHKENQGQAGARASGMKAMTGEYMIHCDPDDWIETNMYEKLYTEAIKTNADVIVCNFIHEFYGHSDIESYKNIASPHVCINNSINAWWSLCNRLIKTKLIINYNLYPILKINFMEDLCLLLQVYYFSSKISYVNEALYHYNRTNETSIMHKSLTSQVIEQKKSAINYIETFFNNQNFNLICLNQYKITIRDEYLMSTPLNLKIWQNTYPEVAPLIYNDKNNKKLYRLVYFLASKGYYFPLKLYIKLSKYRKILYLYD